jgi:hypothetical protein
MSSPVLWARWGVFSRWLARIIPPQIPPILVLSLPRSGSTWVGEIVGYSSRALYLREPVGQGSPVLLGRGTVFAGLPAFHREIVVFPEQWTLSSRRQRHVVVKAVNPLALNWYLERYQPRLIFLLRHPAAVALSWQGLGGLAPNPQAWEEYGAFQGRVLAEARRVLEAYEPVSLVFYEDACVNPEETFRRLYSFAGFPWEEAVAAHLQRRTSGEDRNNLWQTSRNSKEMVDAWRGQMSTAMLAGLRRGFSAYELPWYDDDAQW